MQSSTSVNNRRRIYYIKKDFQRRFILTYIAMVLAGIALSGGFFYALLNKGLDDVFYRAHIEITTTGDVTRSPLIFTGISVVVVTILAVLGFTIYSSWKMNKRFHCFAEGVKGIKNGDLTFQIDSPHNCELVELAAVFNEAVRILNSKVASTKSKVNELEDAALAIQSDSAGSIDVLLSRIDSLEKELSAFKLQGIGDRG